MRRLFPHRYLILRRLVQVSILLLFAAGSALGWKVLRGNLSSSRLLDAVPLADPFALLQILATGTLVSAEALLGGGIVLVLFGVIGGRAFCGWVCPVNMVADLAGSLRSLGRDAHASAALSGHPISRKARYWVLGMSLVLSALLGVAAFEWISPISMLHRGILFGMGLGWTAVLALFLFDLSVQRQGFCGHLCPLGAFYALAGTYGFLRVRHLKDRCTLCGECIRHCPEPQVLPMVGKHSGAVLSGECTNCGRCVDVCAEKAMRFGVVSRAKARQDHEGG